MPLDAGTRLGPYEIVSQLGVGGMGEVYRAQDVRLGRDVALKVVAAHVGISPEVRQRFEREARAIAALSHPNICALFDVGSHDDSDYLVMELLEGESLADRLARGPLPLSLALRWGAQVLAALARAHRGGIVHRDLKPANIMITPSGVKLLDFGLAQLRSEIPAIVDPGRGDDVSLGPTRVAPLTGDGMILGTLQYMAPEQLEGRPVDARSDLFAFGALLYEMVTGTMAFPGSSMASVISAILRDQPQPVSERNPLAPPRLERLIGRCLAKDPEDRWQSAHDLRLQLEELAAVDGAVDEASAAGKNSVGRTARLPALAAALVIAAFLGAAVARWSTPSPVADQPTIRFALAPPEGKIFRGSVESVHFAVSPNGRQVAFVASGSGGQGSAPETSTIWLRSLANEEARQLVGSEGASTIFWSPTGEEIGFFAGGRLKRMAVNDGAPLVICEVSQGIGLAATWGRDAIVFTSVQGEALYRVDLAGGTPERFHEADPARDEYRVHWPWFLPDGRGLLYLSTDAKGSGQLKLIPAGGGEPRLVAPFGSRVETMAPDLLVFAENGALFAQHFDADAGRLVAAPMPLAPKVNGFDATKFAAFAVSTGGTVVFASGQNDGYLAWFDQAGRELGRVGERGQRLTVSISADGRQAIADRYRVDGASYDISLIDLERNIESTLISTPMTEAFPIWMPDERSFIYAAARGRPPQLFRRDLESSEEEQLLYESSFQIPVAALSDGRLLLRRRADQSGFGLFLMQPGGVTGTQPLEEVLPGTRSVEFARLSKDEKWVAYLAAESGRLEAYVKPLYALGAAVRVSSAGATGLGWSADGSELFFTAPDSHLYVAKIETEPSLRVAQAEQRFALPALGWTSFDVGADGRILAIVESAHANAQPLTVVANWSPGR